MSVLEPGSARAGLIARVKNILMQPTATWDVIDGEAATIGGLYRSYVIPLAAIPAVCSMIGMLLFGIGGFGITIHLSPVWVIAEAIVRFVLSLAMVYILALIIDALAPSFGGAKDQMQAFKIAAYAPTASWVAGVFGLVPMLGILAIIGGLYSLYTLYKGLPRLMKTPEDKAMPYFVVVLVAAIVVSVLIGIVTSGVSRFGGGPLNVANAAAVSNATVKVGGASVNLGALEAAGKRAQAAADQMQSGKAVPATDPEVLKSYLPASVAGYARTEVSASGGGAGGIQGSNAEGTYAKGDANIRLAVTDMGAAGAMAGMASAFNVNGSKETATGYEKVGKVDGRMTTESYDRGSHHGEYSILVGDRFMITATGEGASMDELKSAVGSIGPARLEGLAKS